MASMFSGPSSLTPWIQQSVCDALLMKSHENKHPRLAQVIFLDGRLLRISDGATATGVVLSLDAQRRLEEAGDDCRPRLGSVIRVIDWHVSTYGIVKQHKQPNETICLFVNGAVEFLGGHGMGIVGEPVEVNQEIDVRRAVASLSERPSQILSRQQTDRTGAAKNTLANRRSNLPVGNVAGLLKDRSALSGFAEAYKDSRARRVPVEVGFRAYNLVGDVGVAFIVKDPGQMKQLFITVLSHSRQLKMRGREDDTVERPQPEPVAKISDVGGKPTAHAKPNGGNLGNQGEERTDLMEGVKRASNLNGTRQDIPENRDVEEVVLIDDEDSEGDEDQLGIGHMLESPTEVESGKPEIVKDVGTAKETSWLGHTDNGEQELHKAASSDEGSNIQSEDENDHFETQAFETRPREDQSTLPKVDKDVDTRMSSKVFSKLANEADGVIPNQSRTALGTPGGNSAASDLREAATSGDAKCVMVSAVEDDFFETQAFETQINQDDETPLLHANREVEPLRSVRTVSESANQTDGDEPTHSSVSIGTFGNNSRAPNLRKAAGTGDEICETESTNEEARFGTQAFDAQGRHQEGVSSPQIDKNVEPRTMSETSSQVKNAADRTEPNLNASPTGSPSVGEAPRSKKDRESRVSGRKRTWTQSSADGAVADTAVPTDRESTSERWMRIAKHACARPKAKDFRSWLVKRQRKTPVVRL